MQKNGADLDVTWCSYGECKMHEDFHCSALPYHAVQWKHIARAHNGSFPGLEKLGQLRALIGLKRGHQKINLVLGEA